MKSVKCMNLRWVLAIAVSLAPSFAIARVTSPLGRQERPQRRGPATPKLWEDTEGQFALARPESGRWSFQSSVKAPDGQSVPLFAFAQESGAQLVVQSADGISDVRTLARILNDNLGKQDAVRVESIERLLARGGDAFGFEFTVAEETRGRVAVVRTGDRIALVIASWPFGAPPEVVDDVNEMIGSLGPVPGTLAPGVF
ncbi:MAG TPA: hypothetical protein VGH20_17755 [Myxococcales bacterium]|jgi:hypothetical protein